MKIPSHITVTNGSDYCMKCFAGGVQEKKEDGQKLFICGACGANEQRRISFSAPIRWHIDDSRELWHESVGVFVFNAEGKILFFELTKFPFGLTIPAGHSDVGEKPEDSVIRELREETGLNVSEFALLGSQPITNDSCSRGADAHIWHAYTCSTNTTEVTLDASEGTAGRWLHIEDVPATGVTAPVVFLLERYGAELKARRDEIIKNTQLSK